VSSYFHYRLRSIDTLGLIIDYAKSAYCRAPELKVWRGEPYALDSLCNPVGSLAAGFGEFIYIGWFHPHPASFSGGRTRDQPVIWPKGRLSPYYSDVPFQW